MPGGVGPGAWPGIAGSLLSAQAVPTGALAGPVPAGDESTGWHGSARVIGSLSMLAAVLSFGVQPVLAGPLRAANHGRRQDFGKQNIAVIVTAVVYGVVALVAVLVASRWLLRSSPGVPADHRRARRVDAGRRDPGVVLARRS